MIINDHGLVLDHRPFRDRHLLLAVLSCQRGVVRGVLRDARGGRQPAAAAAQILSQVQFSAFQRPTAEMATFQHLDLLRSSYQLGSDLAAAAAAACTAEMLATFCQPGQPASRQYRLGVAVLDALLGGAAPLVVVAYAQAWVLALGGVLPDLDRCAACDAVGPAAGYAPDDGLPLCAACASQASRVLGARDRAFLRACRDLGPDRVELEVPPAVGAWLDLLSRLHAERSLTALDFFRHHASVAPP